MAAEDKINPELTGAENSAADSDPFGSAEIPPISGDVSHGPPPGTTAPRGMSEIALFRAFHHRNYRLYFGGQLVSVIGTFLTNTAMGWLANTLAPDPARKPMVIGLVLFASQIPSLLVGPLAGVWVDRLNRQKLLILTQTLSMIQSFLLAILALTGVIGIPMAVILALAQGLINSMDIPARQAFIVEIVTDRADLPNAIGLNSTIVHGARVIAPALAGLLIHWVGMGYCFLLDGISYIAVIGALLAMNIEPRPPKIRLTVREELTEGFRYVLGFPPARELLTLMAIFSLSGIPAMMVLMPIFANKYGAPDHADLVYGFLGAASGCGALFGAITLAARRNVLGLGRMIGISSMVYGLAVVAFALSHHLWLCLVIVPFAGWGMIYNFASANTILQTLTDDDKRGRIMSFFAMSFMGVMPFGMLAVGKLATLLSVPGDPTAGPRRTILIAGGICIAASVRYWMILPTIRAHVRPIYIKRGILKEIATGLQSAAAPATTET